MTTEAPVSRGGLSAGNLSYLDEHLERYVSTGRLVGTFTTIYRYGVLRTAGRRA